ncbi:MAG: Trigger factor [Patescibacteria group bacterium]|nr:Trigger factor [Patescibacteria group bacterium]
MKQPSKKASAKKESVPKVSASKVENIKITKLDKSQVEITGAISAETFSSFRSKALQNINEEITLDGFRKGKIPEAILISKVGEMPILEEMAELAIARVYPEIIINEKIDALGRPDVSITKLAAGNPLEFKIVTAVTPEIKLADYKKISKEESVKKIEVAEVTDKDVDDALLRIRKSRADHSGHDHEKMTKEEHEKAIETTMPEMTDEFAMTLGDFKNVADLKEKIKVSLAEDKVSQAKEKRRIAISDKLIDGSTIDLPEVLVESELRRIEAQFSDDIERMGVKLEDYVKHAKKSMEEIRAEWKPSAEKKAKLQLILNEIAKVEKLTPDIKEIEAEVNHIVEHYKDADRERATIYAETVLTNEKVYMFLEQA